MASDKRIFVWFALEKCLPQVENNMYQIIFERTAPHKISEISEISPSTTAAGPLYDIDWPEIAALKAEQHFPSWGEGEGT